MDSQEIPKVQGRFRKDRNQRTNRQHYLSIEKARGFQKKTSTSVSWTMLKPFTVCVLSHCSCVPLCVTVWTVACQAPLFMGFSRQEYLSGLPFPSPGDFPDPGIEAVSLMSPAIAGGIFTTSAT